MYHSSKVEFIRSFFGGNVGLKISFPLCLTFSGALINRTLQFAKMDPLRHPIEGVLEVIERGWTNSRFSVTSFGAVLPSAPHSTQLVPFQELGSRVDTRHCENLEVVLLDWSSRLDERRLLVAQDRPKIQLAEGHG